MHACTKPARSASSSVLQCRIDGSDSDRGAIDHTHKSVQIHKAQVVGVVREWRSSVFDDNESARKVITQGSGDHRRACDQQPNALQNKNSSLKLHNE